MEVIEESIKASKTGKEHNLFGKNSNLFEKSARSRNIFNVFRSQFFSSGLEEKTAPLRENGNHKDRPKDEKPPEKFSDKTRGKTGRKYALHHLRAGAKEEVQKQEKPIDRDLRRFKAKYNSSMGNIAREWMGLIYCILILRVNLMKYILANLPDHSDSDMNLQNQILLESKKVFSLIRNAQQTSQEKFLFLWQQLEKLIFNRKVLKNAVQLLQLKDSGCRDWKSADAKLAESLKELEKASQDYKDVQKSKEDYEITAKDALSELDKLTFTKEAQYNALLAKITELKKREVQMRGKILINMKSYKDMKTKKKKLMNVEEKMNKLKREQTALVEQYSEKIKSLRNEIEEKERQIKDEKEEKRKLRSSLERAADYP